MDKQHLDDTALLLVDLINHFDFDGGDNLFHHTKKIVPHVQKLKALARENDVPIIYVNDHYNLWESDSKVILEHCWNDRSKEVLEPLQPEDGDYFLIKPKHSAFFQTPLQSLLEELGRRRLIMAGIAGDICLLFTGQDAYMQNYKMRIPKNCMASESTAGNDHALALMKEVMNADIEPI